MKVGVELGCLQHTQRLRSSPLLDPNASRRVQETYASRVLDVTLPEQGTKTLVMDCPVCSERLTLKLAGLGRIRFFVRCALLLWAVVCGVIGGLVFFLPAKDAVGPMRYIAIGIWALGGVALLAALFVDSIPPSWMGDDLVSIASDDVRERDQGPTEADARGHKILNVTAKPD